MIFEEESHMILNLNRKLFDESEKIKRIEELLEEVDKGLRNPSRCVADSSIDRMIGEVLNMKKTLGSAQIIGLSVAGAHVAGVVGSVAAGSAVGTAAALNAAVAGLPLVIMGSMIFGISSFLKIERIKEKKRELSKIALFKETEIRRTMREESNVSRERMNYLEGLSLLLQRFFSEWNEER